MHDPTPTLCRLSTVLLALAAGAAPAAALPPHPEQIEFPPLDFTPPEADAFRRELPNGVALYLAPSHEFPLVTIAFHFQGGFFLEDADVVGLGRALGSQLRRGGTTTISAGELDERFDFLAADVGTSVGPERSVASLNCLTSSLDEAFVLFMDMLRNPGFDAERLRVHQDQVIEELKQRNDSPMSVAMMSMREIGFGPDHYLGRQPTLATIESITPERLRELHARIFHPGNLVISVTGDFDEAAMTARLAATLEDWPAGAAAGAPPAPDRPISPGLYHAEVAQADLPQGTTLMLQRGITRDDPDAIPMEVMNHILGGGGFTSRIMSRVRSDEGLAYGAGSFLQTQVYFPGVFGAFFQSKNRTVALAAVIILEEIERITREAVGAEELDTAKNAFIERFPQRFASRDQVLSVLVNDEMTARDPDHWRTYRDRVRAVTAEEVTRVARAHLSPEQMAILVVGDWDEIYGGDLEGRASMNDLFDGNVQHLPMRDPLTLEPVGAATGDGPG